MNNSPTVLVVDDTPANLGVVLELLGDAGLRVLVAESGSRALDVLRQQPVDLVLLDVMMPGVDGFATCAQIRQRAEWADLPIIFMTAIDDPTQKVRALDAGAVDYISKPVHPPEVLARVRTHLELRSTRRELQQQNHKLEAEIALRLDAEAQLAQSLDRALLVADREGRVVFSTLRATNLLHKHLPQHQPGRLPPELAGTERYVSKAGALLLHRFTRRDDDALTVLYLIEEHAPPGPAELIKLGLTPRQGEVLYWIAQSKTNGEIAIILGTSPRTIDKHVEQLLERLGVENRLAASARANDVLRVLPQ
jgi:DNA-binding response OmpR family regulator/DNA-binding CsgD family transcriptional regulator